MAKPIEERDPAMPEEDTAGDVLERMDKKKIAKAQEALGMDGWNALREQFANDPAGLEAEIEKHQ